MSNITVVGCGLMGSALVNGFLKNGHHVNVIDTNAKCVEKLSGTNYQYFDSLNQALDCDFIILNLPSYKIAMDILDSCQDKLAGKKIVNTIVCTPVEVTEMEKVVKAAGGRFLDSKIECYPDQIATELAFFVYSGDQELFEELCDSLEALSSKYLFLSTSVAAASVIDLGVVAGFQYAAIYASLQSAALALKNNVPVELLKEVTEIMLPESSLRDVIINQAYAPFYNGFVGEYPEPHGASLYTQYYGLKNTKSAYEQNGIDTTFNEAMEKMMSLAIDKGLGNKGYASVMDFLAKK